jgi:hypothetical protein
MITGTHVIVSSQDPESDRAFIFALPPAEAAFHPSEKNDLHELYFMCDDLKTTMESLKEKNVKCGSIKEERWGSVTTVSLPGGGKIGLYQPKHPTAIRQ